MTTKDITETLEALYTSSKSEELIEFGLILLNSPLYLKPYYFKYSIVSVIRTTSQHRISEAEILSEIDRAQPRPFLLRQLVNEGSPEWNRLIKIETAFHDIFRIRAYSGVREVTDKMRMELVLYDLPDTIRILQGAVQHKWDSTHLLTWLLKQLGASPAPAPPLPLPLPQRQQKTETRDMKSSSEMSARRLDVSPFGDATPIRSLPHVSGGLLIYCPSKTEYVWIPFVDLSLEPATSFPMSRHRFPIFYNARDPRFAAELQYVQIDVQTDEKNQPLYYFWKRLSHQQQQQAPIARNSADAELLFGQMLVQQTTPPLQTSPVCRAVHPYDLLPSQHPSSSSMIIRGSDIPSGEQGTLIKFTESVE